MSVFIAGLDQHLCDFRTIQADIFAEKKMQSNLGKTATQT